MGRKLGTLSAVFLLEVAAYGATFVEDEAVVVLSSRINIM